MIFKQCHSHGKKVSDCKIFCIRPEGRIVKQVSNVIVDVRTAEHTSREIYPSSKGVISLVGNHIFCKKRRHHRVGTQSATVVDIPKKEGWQCFSFPVDEINTIRYSIFGSITGVYLIQVTGNNNGYTIRLGKGGDISLSKKIKDFVTAVENVMER
ncbi:MAG: hypothetical protein U9O96_03580 [Candidatus Thermoplasmatota archaeon]|nr:hypothetical protein [Candidatus Thermoplasmatota archaeon]